MDKFTTIKSNPHTPNSTSFIKHFKAQEILYHSGTTQFIKDLIYDEFVNYGMAQLQLSKTRWEVECVVRLHKLYSFYTHHTVQSRMGNVKLCRIDQL